MGKLELIHALYSPALSGEAFVRFSPFGDSRADRMIHSNSDANRYFHSDDEPIEFLLYQLVVSVLD